MPPVNRDALLQSCDARNRPAVLLLHAHRTQQLPTQLTQLARQTFQDFDLFVINNHFNPGGEDVFTPAITAVQDRFQFIRLVQSPQVGGPRMRQLLAAFLRQREGREFVIFLDDDQIFSNHTIEQLWDGRRPQTAVAMQAYTSQSIDFYPLQAASVGQQAHAFRESGLLIDASIFAKPAYWALWPRTFWGLSTDWLNAFVVAQGWSILQAAVHATFSQAAEQAPRSADKKIQDARKRFDDLFVTPHAGRTQQLFAYDFYAAPTGHPDG